MLHINVSIGLVGDPAHVGRVLRAVGIELAGAGGEMLASAKPAQVAALPKPRRVRKAVAVAPVAPVPAVAPRASGFGSGTYQGSDEGGDTAGPAVAGEGDWVAMKEAVARIGTTRQTIWRRCIEGRMLRPSRCELDRPRWPRVEFEAWFAGRCTGSENE